KVGRAREGGEAGRAGERCQHVEFDARALRAQVEALALDVVSAAGAERAGAEARVQVFEVDSLAAERGLQSDLVERLVANLTGAGAQVCAAVQLVRNAGDVYAARRRPGGGELICEA